MEPFKRLEAVACPLGLENVDTDQLIPARFMSRPRATGYGAYLFHDLRFGPGGESRSFVLDSIRYAGARVLICRRNFGTGSSREAAVYALWDFGIRCVIAPSFGDIFASNAVKNGLLPAQVAESDIETMLDAVAGSAKPHVVVDLEASSIDFGAGRVSLHIDPVRRMQLLNGWDDLDLTLRHQDAIDAFRRRHHQLNPWAAPAPAKA